MMRPIHPFLRWFPAHGPDATFSDGMYRWELRCLVIDEDGRQHWEAIKQATEEEIAGVNKDGES